MRKNWLRTGACNCLLEQLEPRRLLAASAHLVGSVLEIRGNPGRASTINVSTGFSSGATSIDVSIDWKNFRGQSRHLGKSFTPSAVTAVRIRGGVFNDSISVNIANTSNFADTTILGSWGN